MRSAIVKRLTDSAFEKMEDRHRGLAQQGSSWLASRVAELNIPNPHQIPVWVYPAGTDPSGGIGANPASVANAPAQNAAGKRFFIEGYSAPVGSSEATADGRASSAGDYLRATIGIFRTVVYGKGQGILKSIGFGNLQVVVYGAGQGVTVLFGSGRAQVATYGNNINISARGRMQTVVYGAGQGVTLRRGSGRAQTVVYGAGQGLTLLIGSGRGQTVVYGNNINVMAAGRMQEVVYGRTSGSVQIQRGSGRAQTAVYFSYNNTQGPS